MGAVNQIIKKEFSKTNTQINISFTECQQIIIEANELL